MRHRSVFVMALMIVLVGAGCASTPAYNPFKIPELELYGRIKTIALARLVVPRDLEEPGPVRVKFESLIEARLREAGFSIVPSLQVVAIWDSATRGVGGYIDPVTGRRDESKYKIVLEQSLLELSKLNVDAILFPTIEGVQAKHYKGTAEWDGTSEWLKGGSYGTSTALSLVVTIEDINRVPLYIHRGGIQLATKLVKGEFVNLRRDELFTDEKRNVGAVNIALGPLVSKAAPAKAKR